MAVYGFKENKCKKQLNMVVSKVLDTVGWYRVACIESTGAYLINIYNRHGSGGSTSATFLVNMASTTPCITNLSSINKNSINIITGARVVLDNELFYLEIYYNREGGNNVYVDVITETKVSMINFEIPTDTATVLYEIPIGKMIITNSNGTVTKFPDGTMICRTTIDKTNFLQETNSGREMQGLTFYNSKIYNWFFPDEFYDNDIQVLVQVAHNSSNSVRTHTATVDYNNTTKTSTNIQLHCLLGFTENDNGYIGLSKVHAVAVGRWK